ncbi:MAG: 2Fe-2S iron-sulfur cluster-binding protein [Acidimicrobiia bacterium]
MAEVIAFVVDGQAVTVPDDGASLLDALRDHLGVRSVKDGCAPQGQCGCCTVLVDGQPRIACVTPAKRVAGRAITTVDGLADRDRWADAFCSSGGSQCGFCTPGIIVRLSAAAAKGDTEPDQALLAHLCRCTGWQTIREAFRNASDHRIDIDSMMLRSRIDNAAETAAAVRRAELEGHAAQLVSPYVALGRGGFADDTAPAGALVALRSNDGEWVVAETMTEARKLTGKVQGRRSTVPLTWPIDVPDGSWVRTLRTTWVEPAYLEPDAAWCVPGGEPVGPLTNGGAFGGKTNSPVAAAARALADRYGRPVRALWSREDTVRFGPKRPPMVAVLSADGEVVVRVARTPGIAATIAAYVPYARVEEIDIAGPPTSSSLRAAGWAELAALLGHETVTAPNGASARAAIDEDGTVHVNVRCGDPIDDIVLRSYCVGAAHMALGWVRSEGIAVGRDGQPIDMTIRSFGVLRAVDTPNIVVTIEPDDTEPVNGSDAVFAAVAAAAWRERAYAPHWPTDRAGPQA